MRLLLQSRKQVLPVADAIAFDAQQVDVRSRTEQALLQVLAKSVVDGQRDDERSDARRDSDNGDDGDDPNDGLAPFGPQITRRDKEFELHAESSAKVHCSEMQVDRGFARMDTDLLGHFRRADLADDSALKAGRRNLDTLIPKLSYKSAFVRVIRG